MSEELTIYEPDEGTPPGVGLTGFLQQVEACPWGEACNDCGGEIVCWPNAEGKVYDGDNAVCPDCGLVYSWSVGGEDEVALSDPHGRLSEAAMQLLPAWARPRCAATANFYNDPTMPMACDQPAGHAGAHTDESYNCEWTS